MKEAAMETVGINAGSVIAQIIALVVIFLLPIILGFTVVRADARRLGEPGWVWALMTIPLGWLTILAYIVVRALLPRR
jgi:fumarate reductase subunit D